MYLLLSMSDYRTVGLSDYRYDPNYFTQRGIWSITSLTPPLFIELLAPVQVLPLFLQFFDCILELFRQWSFFYVSMLFHKNIFPRQWPVPTSKIYVGLLSHHWQSYRHRKYCLGKMSQELIITTIIFK
jgi:hypothetical protein